MNLDEDDKKKKQRQGMAPNPNHMDLTNGNFTKNLSEMEISQVYPPEKNTKK